MTKGKEAFEKRERKYVFSPRRIDESIKAVELQNVKFKSNWRDEDDDI